MEIKELIDTLRVCADDDIICPACPRHEKYKYAGTAECYEKLMLEAAETIESQRKRIAELEATLREQEERESPKPLTMEELRRMDGEPVFLADLVHKSDPTVADLWGGWIVFTNHNQNGFIPRGGGFFSNYGYGKSWLAYRNKPKEDA